MTSIASKPKYSMELSFVDTSLTLTVISGSVSSSTWVSGNSTLVVYTLSTTQTLSIGYQTFDSLIAITLRSRWNLISLPIVPNSTSIASLLRSQIAAQEVTVVWSYTGTPRTWQEFVPSKGGGLTTMTDGNGYCIDMRKNDTLYVDGTVIVPGSTPPTYTLTQGWNLVGFKPQPVIQNETVAQYLTSISESYDVNNVWIYDNASGAWIRATSTTMLTPGEAMWIFVTSPSGATLRP